VGPGSRPWSAGHGADAGAPAANRARRLVSDQPWRAARLAAEALRQGTDEETHVTLGIALTVLGHYRAARAAYRRGLAHHPASVSILHNLGHLLDVAFERPDAALPYLRAANALLPGEPELAASYAHALGRVGQVERARSVLREALGVADGRADRLLDEWLAGPPEAPPPGSLHAAEA
jgi:Flp pilus assembly protein TadD